MIGIWKIAATELSTANSLSKSTATLIISYHFPFRQFQLLFWPKLFQQEGLFPVLCKCLLLLLACEQTGTAHHNHMTTVCRQHPVSTYWYIKERYKENQTNRMRASAIRKVQPGTACTSTCPAPAPRVPGLDDVM